jgi:predicted nuclease of predicted toxin-antitoxin system
LTKTFLSPSARPSVKRGIRASTLSKSDNAALLNERVFGLGQERKAILVSRDSDFGNVLQFPWGSHQGIVVVRFPSDTRGRAVVDAVVQTLTTIAESEFPGALMVVEPGRARIRRST